MTKCLHRYQTEWSQNTRDRGANRDKPPGLGSSDDIYCSNEMFGPLNKKQNLQVLQLMTL